MNIDQLTHAELVAIVKSRLEIQLPDPDVCRTGTNQEFPPLVESEGHWFNKTMEQAVVIDTMRMKAIELEDHAKTWQDRANEFQSKFIIHDQAIKEHKAIYNLHTMDTTHADTNLWNILK